ncbi:hypothetical protein JOC78_001602 [Bacillus ectoiniformans]|uniref:FusB/FusC family EF-G-binding protein n=1 Tax=Bacillus ectoiniformans TaxID=1494429 RepID=UPI001956A683|nr:FusB/FusC family EF-G-binding protein [Bacillus ectoiniformans]MBM7648656.1 hypothetical protein [Bacillus ectoiniformans]
MEAFMRADQYQFIKKQAKKLVNGHSAANDPAVLKALKAMVLESVIALFSTISDEQKLVLESIIDVNDQEKADIYIENLQPYVTPFQTTEPMVKKLFPKAKKIKVPSLDHMDLLGTSYLSWFDPGTNKKYLVTKLDDQWIGLQGSFRPLNKKGICALCHQYEDVGMFLVEEKGKVQGTFTKRGNYICRDAEVCNQHIVTLDHLGEFIDRVKK